MLAQGGKDGIGVLQEEGSAISGAGSDWQMAYRPFVATATGGSFGPGVELADVTTKFWMVLTRSTYPMTPAPVFTRFWEDGNTVLDYSANGGATWGGPSSLPSHTQPTA